MRVISKMCLLLFLSIHISYANEIKLGENYKIITTFSGKLGDKESFHIVIAKNRDTKKYEAIPISFFNNTLKKLESISFNKQPIINSYHSNNNLISMAVSLGSVRPIRKSIVDLNIITGAYKVTSIPKESVLKASIRNLNKTLLITKHFNILKVYKVVNSQDISSASFRREKQNRHFFKGASSSSFAPIDRDEFVANGSTNSFKVYSDDTDMLHITKDDFSNKFTSILSVNMPAKDSVELSVNSKEFSYDKFSTVREASSYFFEDNLYQFICDRKSSFININNLKTGKLISIVLSDEKIHSHADGFEDLSDFLKYAVKSEYKSTITVNKSSNGDNLIIRCDYVNPITYNYHRDWFWWQFQQPILDHQQMINNSIRSFGPSNTYGDICFLEDAKKHYFEIVLDKDFNLVNKGVSVAYKYKEIDKEKHIKDIKEEKAFEHLSSVFLKDLLVYFYLDTTSNTFKVSNKFIVND